MGGRETLGYGLLKGRFHIPVMPSKTKTVVELGKPFVINRNQKAVLPECGGGLDELSQGVLNLWCGRNIEDLEVPLLQPILGLAPIFHAPPFLLEKGEEAQKQPPRTRGRIGGQGDPLGSGQFFFQKGPVILVDQDRPPGFARPRVAARG